MKENIAILGSTGSIGTQTLSVLKIVNDKNVYALTCNKNINLLKKQVKEFMPKVVAIYNEEKAKEFNEFVKRQKLNIKVYTGLSGILSICKIKEIDFFVVALVGMIGIRPTIEIISNKKKIALANKESLVCAGSIIMPLAKKNNVEIRPIDSEHSAIWQCINGENKKDIKKILITASGGPFFGKDKNYLKNVRLEDTLNHPTWSMGKKITIDSATLVNKGLEVIEAKWLFDVSYKDIEVVVQKQSIIHSMVLFRDNAIIAELSVPSMKIPISYALYKGNRLNIKERELDFTKLKNISIDVVDMETFKTLKLAFYVCKMLGLYPTCFNALNEVAVDLFLQNKINFLDIFDIIENGLIEFKKRKLNKKNITVEDIENVLCFAKEYVKSKYVEV